MYPFLTLLLVFTTVVAVDECRLYAMSIATDSSFTVCNEDGMCSELQDTSCIDAYNALEFVKPLPPSADGLYRMPAEMHAVSRSLIQENSIDDFMNAPFKLKNADDLIAEWTRFSNQTIAVATAEIYFEFEGTLKAITELLSDGNPTRPLYLPEIHRPLLRNLKATAEKLNAILEDESNLDEHETFLKTLDFEIRGSKFLRNYLWIVDKFLVDCLHSRNPTGCTRALVPFVYSVSHIFDIFEIANKVTVNLLGELKYNYLMSAVQFDPEINGTSTGDVSPWRIAMMSNIFDLEHFIEKPILGIPSEGFTVLEQAGFENLETWLDALIADFVRHNMQLVSETRESAKLMEQFTNFFYHVETEIVGLDGRKGVVPQFIATKLCGNKEVVNWFVTNIPSISGFSVFRGVVGFFKLCPATSSMPIRPRIKYLVTNFNAARNRGLVADKIKLHITPGNVLAATLSVFKYIPSYDLKDYDAIEIVMVGGVESDEGFAAEDDLSTPDPTSSPTGGLWGVLQALAVTEESTDGVAQGRLRATATASVVSETRVTDSSPPAASENNGDEEEIGNEADDENEGWETVSESSEASTNSTSGNRTVSNIKVRWIEMAFTEFLETANGVTAQHADDETLVTYPDLVSRDDRAQLRSIGRLIALGLLAGDPGDSISYIVESRTRAGKRGFRDILFFNSESIETGFYDVFNYPLFDLMLEPEEFFAFLTILREPDIRDRALGPPRAVSQTAHDNGDESDDIQEADELAMLRDIHILPHENSDREVDLEASEEDDDDEYDEDDDDEDDEDESIFLQIVGRGIQGEDSDGDDGQDDDEEDEGIDYEREEEDDENDDNDSSGWEDMDEEEESR